MSEVISTAPTAAPEAPAVPAAQSAPEPEATVAQESTPEGETPPEATPEEKLFTQKELNKHIQERLHKESRRAEKLAEARIRAEYAERQLAELKAPKQAEQPSGAPVPAQFQDYESYIAALTKFQVDQSLQSVRQETQQFRQQVEAEQTFKSLQPKILAAQKKYEDFSEVATSFDAPRAMNAAMMESPAATDLYYFFGSNPDELERVSSLSPVQQVREVLKIEARLTAAPTATKAPAPIVPTSGKSTVTKSLGDTSLDEFWKRREQYIKNRR